jgi:hypothetical protein
MPTSQQFSLIRPDIVNAQCSLLRDMLTSQCCPTSNPTLIYIYKFSLYSFNLKPEPSSTNYSFNSSNLKHSNSNKMHNQIDTDFIAPLIFAAVLICGLGYDIFRYLRSDPDAFSWLPFRQRQPVEPEEIELLTIENERGSEHEEGENDDYDHPAL